MGEVDVLIVAVPDDAISVVAAQLAGTSEVGAALNCTSRGRVGRSVALGAVRVGALW